MNAITFNRNAALLPAECRPTASNGRAIQNRPASAFSAIQAEVAEAAAAPDRTRSARITSTSMPFGIAGAPAPSSAARTITAASSIVHTPVGEYDLDHLEMAKSMGGPSFGSVRFYYYEHAPGDYANDPEKMALFGETYGQQALSVLKTFGQVPENANSFLVASPEQKGLFREDGVRAYYTVLDLVNMPQAQRDLLVNISDAELNSFIKAESWDTRITTDSNLTLTSYTMSLRG